MENLLNPEEGFYLERWFVDPLLCRVSRAEKHIRVEPKVMDVLVLLALNQNRVLRKDEIIHHIWGGVNVVENVLARAISEIRKIFGDDAKKQNVIQTIPKVGYRLIAKVSQNREITENLTDFGLPILEMPAGAYAAEFNNRPFWRKGTAAGAAILLIFAALLIMAMTLAGSFERRVEIKKVIIRPTGAQPNG